MEKKKILIPIFNRAHYGRLRSVLKAINDHPSLDLQIITSSPVAYDSFFMNIRHSRPHSLRLSLPWYIRARLLSFFSKFNSKKIIESDFLMRKIINCGFTINKRVPMFFDGGSSVAMVKSVGYGLIKLADDLRKLKPDLIFVNADRFEMMAIALAAAYLNIPIAHNEGGDVSGTIDENIRHSITKLSHIHFTATEKSRNRVIQMGENPANVFAVGSPAIDNIKNLDLATKPNVFPLLDINKPYLLALFHPVTVEKPEINIKMAENIFKVIEYLAMPTVLLGTNVDAKSKEVGMVLKKFVAKGLPFLYHAKHLHPDDFYRILSKAACALGNSSSFIREGAYFGTPAVLVGSRQNNRERGKNVRETGTGADEIKSAVISQIKHGRYEPELIFGNGEAGKKIADILSKIKPDIQKKFFDINLQDYEE